MAKKMSGLGKGLGALMQENSIDDGLSTNTLPISEIVPNRDQPRKTFDEAALAELAQSIEQHGILQPLLVRPMPSGNYQLVAGERRWRAAMMCKLTEVPVVIKELSDNEAMELAIIENLQREDLNPIEEAEGLQALADKCGYTQEEIANAVGKSRPAIANALRLLRLPEEVREMTKNGAISAGHARALLAFDNPAMMLEAANQIVSRKLTVRDVEKMARAPRRAASRSRNARRDSFYNEVELSLAETLGRKVKVVNSGKGGTLQIEFYSPDDLKNIANALYNE
ncbi:MAG: ParB/RepB/Spo0J family partition protein [Eubacterium sp.]|nr:ParB/RepB/Spo0J family partition protein [Eubacterium sp.]MBR7072947.1 ParB/RepB/Spo0J family partition protein [Eubacterium sp.]